MDGNRHSSNDVKSLSSEEVDAATAISIEQLQRLVYLLDRSDVSELELRRAAEGIHLVLRKAKAEDVGSQFIAPSSENAAPLVPTETKHSIVAPFVGTFHAWAKPKGRPLVSVGDRVKIGQRVASIQSLNVINEVETSVAGCVTEIFVQEGQPVEYGQLLMTIDSTEDA